MWSAARTLGSITLRRSVRSRPVQASPATLPLRFARQVTIYAPGPSDSSDSSDAQRYEIIPPSGAPSSSSSDASSSSLSSSSSSNYNGSGSSQHPFASHFSDSHSDSASNASSSSSSSSIPAVTSLPPPPESVTAVPPPNMQHPFDTHAFVSYLEKSDLSCGTAETLMEAVREMIVRRGERTRDNMVGKEDMENAAYLFRAALSELRTELSVRARNDGVALKAMTAAIQREVDSLEQKMKEDVQTLKHDIEMDMNNRKSETRTEMKGFDIAIEEINNKFTISLGDLRTEIESAKWDATRRAISIIVLLVVAGVAVTLYTAPAPVPEKPVAKPALAPMRDIAVGSEDDIAFDGDVGFPEDRLEKLLSESGVGKVERVRPKGEGKKDELRVDRI